MKFHSQEFLPPAWRICCGEDLAQPHAALSLALLASSEDTGVEPSSTRKAAKQWD